MGNTCFPATVGADFFEALQHGKEYISKTSKGEIKIPLGYTTRHQTATGNPVAVALDFQTMIENIIEILIGIPLDFCASRNS